MRRGRMDHQKPSARVVQGNLLRARGPYWDVREVELRRLQIGPRFRNDIEVDWPNRHLTIDGVRRRQIRQ